MRSWSSAVFCVLVSAAMVTLAACDRRRGSASPTPRYGPPPGYPPPGYPPPGQPPPGQPPPGYPSPAQRPPPPQPTYPPQPPATPANPLGDLLDQLLKSGPPVPGQLPGWPFPTPFPQPGPPPQPGSPQPTAPPGNISPRALDLANTINQYRVQNGLPPVPISRSLTHVAESHVRDLFASPRRPGCNAHSWTSNGPWTGCCYTPDHAQAKCMWNKPGEMTPFKATGFEIAIGKPGEATGYALNSQRSLDLWRGSPSHHDVILNRGKWADDTWNAMGAGIIDSHSAVWFAKERDPSR